MNWDNSFRQTHRGLPIVFMLAVIAAFLALAQERPVVSVSYVSPASLALLWLSGMYLFAQPYATKWRDERRSD